MADVDSEIQRELAVGDEGVEHSISHAHAHACLLSRLRTASSFAVSFLSSECDACSGSSAGADEDDDEGDDDDEEEDEDDGGDTGSRLLLGEARVDEDAEEV